MVPVNGFVVEGRDFGLSDAARCEGGGERLVGQIVAKEMRPSEGEAVLEGVGVEKIIHWLRRLRWWRLPRRSTA